jgi:hypothetical protein
MILVNPSAESLIRFLVYLGGVASTLVGSWVSSKIHVYQDNRKAHLEDIKQKVLSPLSLTLADQYSALVTHQSPAVVEEWGARRRKESASVTEYQSEDGPLLTIAVPDMMAALDPALYADAKKNHFSKLLKQAEAFSETWRTHATECHAWVVRLADEILAKSAMQPFPVPQFGTPNVNHLKLGLFVYRRLFCFSQHSLLIHARNLQTDDWIIEGFQGTSAEGKEQQLRALVSFLDDLVAREKETAEALQAKARTVEQKLSTLRSELNYAIASRRLRKGCDLVPFI